jgi:maltose O-acetyltransferase
MRTEKEKMLAGDLYDPGDPELSSERTAARLLCLRLASLDPDSLERSTALRQLLGYETDAAINFPFHCDYGYNLLFGRRVYVNVSCVFLDVAPIRIGNDTLIGPGVHIYAATHPMDATVRRSGLESASPVTLEEDVWVGGGAIICPGVTIGAGAVIGAGSVVARSIPANVFAAGNPCRVIRSLGARSDEA